MSSLAEDVSIVTLAWQPRTAVKRSKSVRNGAPGRSMKEQNRFRKFRLTLARTLRDTWRAKVTFYPAWQPTKLLSSAVGAEYASWQHKKNLNSTITHASVLFHLARLLGFPSLEESPPASADIGTTNQDQGTTEPASAVKAEQEGASDDGLLNIHSHSMNVFFSWGRISSQAVTAVFPMLLDNNGGLRFGNDYR